MHLRNLLADLLKWAVLTSLLIILISFPDKICLNFEKTFIPYVFLVLFGLSASIIIYFREKTFVNIFTKKISRSEGMLLAVLVAIALTIFTSYGSIANLLHPPKSQVCFILPENIPGEEAKTCKVLDGVICCPKKHVAEMEDLLSTICSLNQTKCTSLNATVGKFLYRWAGSGREEYKIFASNALMGELLNIIDDIGREKWAYAVIPSITIISAFTIAYILWCVRNEET